MAEGTFRSGVPGIRRRTVLRGIDELIATLRSARAASSDLTRLWISWRNALQIFFADRFETAANGSWAPLAPSTIRSRRGNVTTRRRGVSRGKRTRQGGNKGGVTRPLWDYGVLRGSLVSVGEPGAIRIIEPMRMEFGTSDPRAPHHHFGAPKAHIPKREIFPDPLPGDLIAELDRRAEEFLDLALAGGGGSAA